MEVGHFNIYDYGMILVFLVGYGFIACEHWTKINKATVSLLMAVACWVLAFLHNDVPHAEMQEFLYRHISDTSQVIFFLLGAMTIVEIVNAHNGFAVITEFIRVRSKKTLLWAIGFIAFFLSAVIDNLTTTIVMVSLLQKLLHKKEDRPLFGGMVVIAANAGGAWTAIGDVTTTMLWIGGQISAFNIMQTLIFPSLFCLLVPLAWLSFNMKSDKSLPIREKMEVPAMSKWIFAIGIASLFFVPVFKVLTGLPPFMAVLFGLAVLWAVTDIIHKDAEEKAGFKVGEVLTRIDHSTVLFFLGILLCINALEATKILTHFAELLSSLLGNLNLIAIVIGIISAIVDNVPLVAATMGMYDLSVYPADSVFWQLIAYCAGTGGSLLIIGSAAGVAFMGMEKVDFFWYLRRITFPALLGYFAGIVIFFLMQ